MVWHGNTWGKSWSHAQNEHGCVENKQMDQQKKLVAAICHGPWVMISAEICEGRKMTAFWSIEADVKNSGADYQHKVPVVIDDNFITSPHYNNNGDFMKSIVKYLSNK